MSENNHLKFNFAPDHIGQANISVQLENNLVSWLNHCFLEIGGWQNAQTGLYGYYGGVEVAKLYPVKDPNYSNYQVWQGSRKDWVYESGDAISYSFGDPIVCSGIYVNNTFYPQSTTGAYAHSINFVRGAIIFTNSGAISSGAITSGSSIRAAHSYRLVQIYKSDADWFKKFQFYSFRNDSAMLTTFGSGAWDIDWRNRVQLPAILVEVGDRQKFAPWQLGTLAQYVRTKVNFYVFAEDEYWRNQIVDLLSYQNDRTIYLYDVNRVEDSGKYPLNVFGSLVSGGMLYPDLIRESGDGGFRYKRAIFKDTSVAGVQPIHENLHKGVVRTTIEVIM